MKKRILVTGRLPGKIITSLSKRFQAEINMEDRPFNRQKLLHRIKDKDGLLSMITDDVNEEVLGKANHLKMIAQFGVGYNNIDVLAATKLGIPVSNTPGVLTDATAELAFALILAISRRLVEGDRITREGRFRWWAPMLFLGSEVTGKTLGVIGMGKIGKAVAQRAKCFNMPILYHNRARISVFEEKELMAKYVDMKTLLSRSDFISLHVPLSDETRHLIGSRELSLMKPTAYLINTSRGPVVDEKALLQALRRKKIGGAALDVYENEPALTPGLVELDNVVLLPHVGSGTLETRFRMAAMAAGNLITGLNGKVPPNLVNPDVISHRRL
ncbi:MAG TPA: D-glycerate dehydrogenase [Syntrophales bacterium]|nr:D-glycerate dehydrogenase [Syntrophales bacterium]